jgi:hypothetical protein
MSVLTWGQYGYKNKHFGLSIASLKRIEELSACFEITKYMS